MPQNTQLGGFDQLSIERAVHSLSRTGVRSPLNVERVRQWVKQFSSPAEKTLAWLILRNLIFRTSLQLESSMRQALKQATLNFVAQQTLDAKIGWRDVLAGDFGLSFLCGPPSLMHGFTLPGKSGDLITRSVNRQYRLTKSFPSDICTLEENERFLIVDDGTYTGKQISDFLRQWDRDYSSHNIAIAVAIAHKRACKALKDAFPEVPLFYGELLAPEMCFESLCQQWVDTQQWQHENLPMDVYKGVYERNQAFENGVAPMGFGGIGALVAYEHGVPDDSIQLLWDRSPTWTPLVER